MYTTHGHWFAPAVPGETAPPMVCGGPTSGCLVCTTEQIDFNLKVIPGASAAVFGMPAVLTSPAPAPAVLPPASDKPLAVPIDGIKDWYTRYLELKAAAKQIEDMLDEARDMLLDAVESRYPDLPVKTDLTIDGKPVLQRQSVTQTRVDTKRLKADQPEVAARYSVTSTYRKLNIL